MLPSEDESWIDVLVRNKLQCVSLLSTMALIYFIVLERKPDKPRNINTTFVMEMEADMPESRIVLGALPRIPSDPDPVKAYREKQTLERLKYLGEVKKSQHDTLYTVLVPENPLVSRLRTQYEAVNGKLTILKIEPISVPSMDIYTLGDILESNDDKSAEIFKIDIEGGEHSVLIPFLQEYRVCQLLIEMHWTANSHTQLLQKIATLDYALFSFQPNALSPTKDCSEYSFIHMDCLEQYGASVTKLYLKDVKPAFG
ncbi:unnamed protein product [Heligmosomoides polygyrus]|uniref:Methyltransf_21 domain-containing protein n=1 Tax=Heligmosomoides polygyrus TaxID=6339 RepID=A0A3P7Z2A1_HELPZ|nr:unnamed protein product [Heligmosomoides polygyrus]